MQRNRHLWITGILLIVAWAAGGQSPSASRLTVDDVIRLAKAGMSEDVILTRIRAAHQTFDLSTDELIALKKARVSDGVIRAMMAQPAGTTVVKTAAAANIAMQWTTHNDPAGFTLNVPANWTVRTNRTPGRIEIEGPQGQRAIIWPTFVEQRQLDAAGAAPVALQMAQRMEAGINWGAPQGSGGVVRIYSRTGADSGAAVMRWSGSPDGTNVLMFCAIAPAALYRASLDTFARVLQSFQVTADPNADKAAAAKGESPATALTYVQWTDPREHAVNAQVPQGWSVSGGSQRLSATDIHFGVVILSPDRQMRVAIGDTDIPGFIVPTPMMLRLGMREGTYYRLGDGGRLLIRAFTPAQQFVRDYVQRTVARECRGPRIVSENSRQDLADSARRKAAEQGAMNPQVTAAGVAFSCEWNGGRTAGYYALATILPMPQRSGIWYVQEMSGYLAAPELEHTADEVSRHVLSSMGVNANWQATQNQIAANAVTQDNARSAQIQAQARAAAAESERQTTDTIVKGYEARSKVYDEVSRRRENAILGTVDVVDPVSGQQYKIDNVSDYHWMGNQGNIVGTKTDTSPGLDFHQMLTLP